MHHNAARLNCTPKTPIIAKSGKYKFAVMKTAQNPSFPIDILPPQNEPDNKDIARKYFNIGIISAIL